MNENRRKLCRIYLSICPNRSIQFDLFIIQKILSIFIVKDTYFINNFITFYLIGIFDEQGLRFLVLRLKAVFLRFMTDLMVPCDKKGHTFSALCCSNSKD
jgi:hypothetical protein